MAKVPKKSWTTKKDNAPVVKYKYRVAQSLFEPGLPYHVIEIATGETVATYHGDYSAWEASMHRDQLNR